jgi:hypothetical protein
VDGIRLADIGRQGDAQTGFGRLDGLGSRAGGKGGELVGSSRPQHCLDPRPHLSHPQALRRRT